MTTSPHCKTGLARHGRIEYAYTATNAPLIGPAVETWWTGAGKEQFQPDVSLIPTWKHPCRDLKMLHSLSFNLS